MATIDRSVLLPPYLEDSQAWADLTAAIDTVFGPNVDDPTKWLARLRDTWILKTGTELTLQDMSKLIASTDFEVVEKNILVRQANMLGFDFAESDLMSSDDYQRLVRNISKYWYGKGTPQLQNFLGFVLDNILTITNLWSTQGSTYDTYGPFLPEGDPGIGLPVWKGGNWFPTTHVTATFDPFALNVNFSMHKLVALFYSIANYNLVLKAVIMEGSLYLHSVDETKIGRIVTATPMETIDIRIETVSPALVWQWVLSNPLPVPLYGHTSTVLNDGRILVTGGIDDTGTFRSDTYIGTVTGTTTTWVTSTALPDSARADHTVTRLSDGRILLIGGYTAPYTTGPHFSTTYWIGEIVGNAITWTQTDVTYPTAPWVSARSSHTTTLLTDNRVFFFLGLDEDGDTGQAKISPQYSFGTISGNSITWDNHSFPYTGPQYYNNDRDMVLLPTGNLWTAQAVFWSEQYTPLMSNISVSGNTLTLGEFAESGLPTPPNGFITSYRAGLLTSNSVLFTGGKDAVTFSAAYLGTISGNTISWATFTALPAPRAEHSMSILPTGSPIVIGGYEDNTAPVATNTVWIGMLA